MISIIIPIYNAERYLDKCLKSILAQDYKNYEVLMINDGSTDGSVVICNKYQEQDGRFKTIHKTNGGSASARNMGLDLAIGEYLTFIDADDFVSEDYLFRLWTVAEQYEADIVQCKFQKVYSDKQRHITESKNPVIISSNLEVLKAFCGKAEYLSVAVLWNKIYKREIFENLRFPEGKGIDDEYLICQVIYKAKKIALIEDVLYFYFMSDNSQMRSKPTLKRIDQIDVLEKQLRFFMSIERKDLHNMLLYRYYSCVVDGYYYIKKYFPTEITILRELKRKNKGMYSVLFGYGMRFSDKIILLFRNLFPNIFKMIHGRVRK